MSRILTFGGNESAAEADAAPEQDLRKTQSVATINAAELPGLLRALSWRRVVVVVGGISQMFVPSVEVLLSVQSEPN